MKATTQYEVSNIQFADGTISHYPLYEGPAAAAEAVWFIELGSSLEVR